MFGNSGSDNGVDMIWMFWSRALKNQSDWPKFESLLGYSSFIFPIQFTWKLKTFCSNVVLCKEGSLFAKMCWQPLLVRHLCRYRMHFVMPSTFTFSLSERSALIFSELGFLHQLPTSLSSSFLRNFSKLFTQERERERKRARERECERELFSFSISGTF